MQGVLAALAAASPSWTVEIGRPEGPGWIAGDELRDASRGPFHALLLRIGERSKTTDRRTIAASFAVRFGWASGVAIAPYLRLRCVPDIALGNISFKFTPSTFFERSAIHHPRGVVVAGDPRATDPTVTTVASAADLLRVLRDALAAQGAPVVEALHRWSGFAERGTWGMLTSSWVSHVTGLCDTPDDQRPLLPIIDRFFAGTDVVAAMRPRMHAVTCGSATHLFQRRASCCRWYLLPQGELCASCPLVSQEDRVQRNEAWMQAQRARQGKGAGHD
jgi:hypothetical protein